MQSTAIPGQTFGTDQPTPSPVSDEDFERLKASVLFGSDDERALRQAGDVLGDQVEDVLDVWNDFVASHSHLVAYFSTPEGEQLDDYLARVRRRFGQWILGSCRRAYDRTWLDYQEEIALRTRGRRRTRPTTLPPAYPAAVHGRLRLPDHREDARLPGREWHGQEEVEAMHQAWFKAVTLQVARWSEPYAREGDW